MVQGKLTKRYTRALFELAVAANAAEDIAKNLAQLGNAYQSSSALRDALQSPSVSMTDKAKVINGLLDSVRAPTAHALTRNFCRVLLDRGRIGILPSVAEAFQQLQDDAAGRIRAEVVSAKELSAADRIRLKTALTKSLGATEVRLDIRVDPSLLAGVVTRVGNVVLDSSLRNRLEGMREHLLQR